MKIPWHSPNPCDPIHHPSPIIHHPLAKSNIQTVLFVPGITILDRLNTMQYILFAYKLVLYYNSKRGGWTFPGGLVMRIYFRASYYCTYAINPCMFPFLLHHLFRLLWVLSPMKIAIVLTAVRRRCFVCTVAPELVLSPVMELRTAELCWSNNSKSSAGKGKFLRLDAGERWEVPLELQNSTVVLYKYGSLAVGVR